MDKLAEYDKAVIVTSDGDFASLITYLIEKNKLHTVLSPSRAKCSYLLRRAAQGHIDFLEGIRSKIELKRAETIRETTPQPRRTFGIASRW